MVNNNKKGKRKAPKIIKTVFVETVQNKDVPIIITANGNLVAKNKIELFSEVQGILKPLSKDFKAGTT
ncbi:MAG: efflux transporter periplasmic adaptor subunit, partial [Bacteroidetes bacterium]